MNGKTRSVSSLRYRPQRPARAIRSAASLAALAFSASAFAATWTGGSGNWGDGTKWSPQGVPNGQSTDVLIDGNAAGVASTVEMNLTSGATARSLTVDAGDTLSLGQSNRYLTLHGNATINGTLTMAGSNVRLIMAGGGSRTIGGAGEIRMNVSQGGIDPGFTASTGITIGPNLTVRGNGGIQGGPVLINNGTLLAENGSLVTFSITNNGLLRALAPQAAAFSEIFLAGNWDNNGSIVLDAGTSLAMDGTFDTDDIGSITRGANTSISLLGDLNNAGRSIDLNTSTGSVRLNGGTIRGGTVTSSGDARLIVFGFQSPNTLDGVTLATGPVFADRNRRLTVANTLTLENVTIDLSAGANNFTSNNLGGGSLAGTGTILLGTQQASINSENELTSNIGPGILVRGTGIVSGLNQGTIRADIAGAKLQLSHVENDGLVHATNDSVLTLYRGGSRPFVNRGTVRIDAGSTFDLLGERVFSQSAGQLCVNGALSAVTDRLDVSGGTLSGSGTFTVTPSTAAPRLNVGGTLSPGQSHDGLSSVATLTLATNLRIASGARYLAEIDGSSADLLRVVGGTTFGGDLELGPETFLDIQAADELLYDTPYLIVTYTGTLVGTFGHVSPNFDVDYSTPNAIYVTAVPEPACLAFLPLFAFVVGRRPFPRGNPAPQAYVDVSFA